MPFHANRSPEPDPQPQIPEIARRQQRRHPENGHPGPLSDEYELLAMQGDIGALAPLSKVCHEKARDFIRLGNRHYNSFLAKSFGRDLDLAIDYYRKALESNPNLAEGYVKLASALYDKGEMTLVMAIHYCQRALEMNPAHAEANLFLGYFLRLSGNVDGALAQFRLAIQKAPLMSAKPRMAYGRMLLNQRGGLNAFLKGLWYFGSGLALLPTDVTLMSALRETLIADIRMLSLLGLAKTTGFLGLRPLSLGLYQWGTRQMPNEPVLFHHLGDAHRKEEKWDAALYFYNRAQELAPTDLDLMKKRAQLYLQLADMENGIQCLETLVASLPEGSVDFEAVYNLAQLYTERGEFMRALYYFKELGVKYDENPYVHSNMAYVLFKLEDYDGAIKEYQSAVSYGDDPVWTATVAQTLGTIYYQLKDDLSAAIEMFKMAYQLDPTNLECIVQLADMYIEQGSLEAAIGAYQYILNFEPDNADCHTYIGYLLWQLDRNDEAVSYYLKAIGLNPDCHVAYNNLGVIYLDEDCNPDKAHSMFRMALDIQPSYTLACFNLGRSFEAQGDISNAAKIYSQAISLNADNRELAEEEILLRLDRLFDV